MVISLSRSVFETTKNIPLVKSWPVIEEFVGGFKEGNGLAQLTEASFRHSQELNRLKKCQASKKQREKVLGPDINADSFPLL